MKKVLLLLFCFTVHLFAARKTETLLQEINAVQNITQLSNLSSILSEVANSKEDKQYTIKAAIFLKLMEIKPALFSYSHYIKKLQHYRIPQSLIINVAKTVIKDAVELVAKSPEKYVLTIQELGMFIEQVDIDYLKPEIKMLLHNDDASLLLLHRSLGEIITLYQDSASIKKEALKVFNQYWQIVKECEPSQHFYKMIKQSDKVIKQIDIVLKTGKGRVKEQFNDEHFEHEETGTVKTPRYEKFLIQQKSFDAAFNEFKQCVQQEVAVDNAFCGTNHHINSQQAAVARASIASHESSNDQERYSVWRPEDQERYEEQKRKDSECSRRPLPPVPSADNIHQTTIRASQDSGIDSREPLALRERSSVDHDSDYDTSSVESFDGE